MLANLPSSQRGEREFLIKSSMHCEIESKSPHRSMLSASRTSDEIPLVVIRALSSLTAPQLSMQGGLNTVTCFYVRRFPTFTGCVAES